jgi:hypothetical protein
MPGTDFRTVGWEPSPNKRTSPSLVIKISVQSNCCWIELTFFNNFLRLAIYKSVFRTIEIHRSHLRFQPVILAELENSSYQAESFLWTRAECHD